MGFRSRRTVIAHFVERVGLAMAGASGGLFVAAHLAGTNVEPLIWPSSILVMMVFGATGFYLGVDIPPPASAPDAASRAAYDTTSDIVEVLSAVGTFLATLAAFVAVSSLVLDNDMSMISMLVVGGGWLLGGAIQIVAGTVARLRA